MAFKDATADNKDGQAGQEQRTGKEACAGGNAAAACGATVAGVGNGGNSSNTKKGGSDTKPWCALGSIKGNIAHANCAAGQCTKINNAVR